jgi:hypothetical protein
MKRFWRPKTGVRRPWRQSDARMAADLERFGRHMYDLAGNPWPWRSAGQDFLLPMYYCYEASQDAFLAALADLAEEHRGWAAYGAERLMVDVAGGDLDHPAYRRIMDCSLAFLRVSGVPQIKTTGYEWNHWLASGGTVESWTCRRPTPAQEQAPTTDLAAGQRRRLVRLTKEDQSNVFFVQQAPDGDYQLIIEARYSDDDPRRTERISLTTKSLYEIYVRVGLMLQEPPYWFDRELEPYFPLPMPDL